MPVAKQTNTALAERPRQADIIGAYQQARAVLHMTRFPKKLANPISQHAATVPTCQKNQPKFRPKTTSKNRARIRELD